MSAANTATRRPITRALISVFDKTGIDILARALADHGVEIVSTGSTARTIEDAGVRVTHVEELTGFPECLDGRVKTLHPRVHAGILADQTRPEHVRELAQLNIAAFDLVVVNLYPFADTVASGASEAQCVEQIDIGGPSMVRAAAKNHRSVAVVVNAERYPQIVAALGEGGMSDDERLELAAEAFAHTASYDAAVASWFAQCLAGDDLPGFLAGTWRRTDSLRYGENPHQRGAIYVAKSGGLSDDGARGLAGARQLHGKAMSFNNYTDTDAAIRAAWDHDQPCVAIIKHANPCGIAVADTVAAAHRAAHACDPVSAFGGVIACNREVSIELAEQITPIFTEVVAAPSFAPGALEILARKKNLRVLEIDAPQRHGIEYKPISGGIVVHDRDAIDADGDDPAQWQLVAGNPADAETMRDLVFAWRCVRAVRSNAILLAKNGASVGVGMGQVNRVDSCALAVERANTLGERHTGDAASDRGEEAAPPRRADGAVAASDAFFPFSDGVKILADAGVRAIVQPGGSIRDAEAIAAADAAGITMYLTGTRHFSH